MLNGFGLPLSIGQTILHSVLVSARMKNSYNFVTAQIGISFFLIFVKSFQELSFRDSDMIIVFFSQKAEKIMKEGSFSHSTISCLFQIIFFTMVAV